MKRTAVIEEMLEIEPQHALVIIKLDTITGACSTQIRNAELPILCFMSRILDDKIHRYMEAGRNEAENDDIHI